MKSTTIIAVIVLMMSSVFLVSVQTESDAIDLEYDREVYCYGDNPTFMHPLYETMNIDWSVTGYDENGNEVPVNGTEVENQGFQVSLVGLSYALVVQKVSHPIDSGNTAQQTMLVHAMHIGDEVYEVRFWNGNDIIETVERIYDAMPSLTAAIPQAIDMKVVIDRTPTIRSSLKEVEFTLLLTIFLVVLVIYAFLRDGMATIIPSLALPLSVVAAFPLIGFQIVTAGFFQSIGRAGTSIVLSLTRQFIFLVPALLALPPLLGLDGAWWAQPVADTLATLATGAALWRFVRERPA